MRKIINSFHSHIRWLFYKNKNVSFFFSFSFFFFNNKKDLWIYFLHSFVTHASHISVKDCSINILPSLQKYSKLITDASVVKGLDSLRWADQQKVKATLGLATSASAGDDDDDEEEEEVEVHVEYAFPGFSLLLAPLLLLFIFRSTQLQNLNYLLLSSGEKIK